jgi:hypothetical protein
MATTASARPIVSSCGTPGCETLTIGPACVIHDRRPKLDLVRGRPFAHPVSSSASAAGSASR